MDHVGETKVRELIMKNDFVGLPQTQSCVALIFSLTLTQTVLVTRFTHLLVIIIIPNTETPCYPYYNH
jgi:phosphatidylserine synthase